MFSGKKTKLKQPAGKEKLTRNAPNMTAAQSSRSALPQRQSQRGNSTYFSSQLADSDLDYGLTPISLQNIPNNSDILSQFERVLQKALQNTSDTITEKLTREIREVGRRTSILEHKMEDINDITNTHTDELEALKEENFTLHTRLEDFENRARRSNLRLRGIPETIIDLQSTITALFQELAPSIPIERLEMDRIHRTLAPKKEDGPPRDIVIKLHYFRTKEQLMEAARNKDTLTFQGHRYQVFHDLSQQTLYRRKEMKPHLQILQYHHIPYRWSFPFALRFTYKGTTYTCKKLDDLLTAIQELRLSIPDNSTEGSKRRASSNSPKAQQDNPTQLAHSSTSKRSRFASPPPNSKDQMD